MYSKLLVLIVAIASVFLLTYPHVSSAQISPIPTPVHPSPPYTPPLNTNAYPCSTTRVLNPEFHPLRPYPANPCDPLIPQKTPEAQFAPPVVEDGKPQDLYLSFRCSPSAEPTGLYTVKDVVFIGGLTVMPDSGAQLDRLYLCPGNSSVTGICFIHRVSFNVALNYSTSMLPVMGNTQNYMLDVDRVNNYLTSYLNGTVLHAESPTAAEQPRDDIFRLENYSGPLKKLLSYETQRILRTTLGGGSAGTLYHNYQITGDGRIHDSSNDGTNPNAPLTSMEDITSEVTVSLPVYQPTSGNDGFIVPGTVSLSIGAADSRLYFPHLRSTNALSQLLASTSRPGFIYDEVYTPVAADSVPLVSQQIPVHQGINDSTSVIRYDYLTNTNTRNTEVIPNRNAPDRLYESDPICQLSVGPKPGDDLVGNTVNALLSYTMYFRYTPQLVIGDPCGSNTTDQCIEWGTECSDLMTDACSGDSCCWGECPDIDECSQEGFQCIPGSSCQSVTNQVMPYSCSDSGLVCCANTTSTSACAVDPAAPSVCFGPGAMDCSVITSIPSCNASYCCAWANTTIILPGTPAVARCPDWPDRDLRSTGRVAIFTKTPMVETIYDTLVASNSSVLRRFLPQDIATSSSIPVGRSTKPAATQAQYTATSDNLHDVSLTGGSALYFSHLGSIFNHFLGAGGMNENINIQCLFRPRGYCRRTFACGDIQALLDSVDINDSCQTCTPELGPLATQILNVAGTMFDVPAANIWAAMWHEGAGWDEFEGQFTNENVLKWSLPERCGGEPMPRCNNDDVLTQPPFGWLSVYFYADGIDAPWTAVSELDPTRNTKDTVTRCNFLDAAFATAKGLHADASLHSGEICGSYTLPGVRPATCLEWNDANIAASQVGYLGQCPDTSASGPYETLPYTIQDVVDVYHDAQCH